MTLPEGARKELRDAMFGYGPISVAVALTVLTAFWGPVAAPTSDLAPPAPPPRPGPPAPAGPAPPWEHEPICAADPEGDVDVVGQRPGEEPAVGTPRVDVRRLCVAYGRDLQVEVGVDGELALPADLASGTRMVLRIDGGRGGQPGLTLRLEAAAGAVRAEVLDRTYSATPRCTASAWWSSDRLIVHGVPAACLHTPAGVAISGGLDYYDPDTFFSRRDALPTVRVARA